MRIVVIGAVAAGLKAAAKARRGSSDAVITVVDKGEIISYGACGMPYYVSGEVKELDELYKTPAGIVRSAAFFKSVKDVNVLTRTMATAIDRAGKTVTVRSLADGTESVLPYDKLVIATGASPLKPPIAGVELKNIFAFWHPNDARSVKEGLASGAFRQAVVVGAGLVGMEMAEALFAQGVKVSVVEMKEQIFPQLLDSEMAKIVEQNLVKQGIGLFLGERVEKFTGDTAVSAVQTDKRTLAADLVIMAMGVRPNVELAKAAGLELGATGAILVDDGMRTSDPDIFAGGDCVENKNIVSGKQVYAPMGSTANKHGRVIGVNLTGGKACFKGVLNTGVVRMMNLNAGKTGLTESDAQKLGYNYLTVIVSGHDRPHYMPEAKLITVKMIADADNRRILGVQAVGEGDVAKRIDVVATLLNFGGTIDDLFDVDLSYAPPFNSPIDNMAVAANSMMNKFDGFLKGVSSHQAKELLADDKVMFLDVRTPGEFEQVKLSGADNVKHIPLGQLRNRLSELSKDGEIVAFCKISLRGYEAQCILEGEGFENVKVLEGGIVAWPY